MFGQKGGCNKTFFFVNLCFAKCEKLSFLGHFWGRFCLMLKNTMKISSSAKNKNIIFQSYELGQVTVINWAKFGDQKKGRLGPMNNFENVRAQFSFI